VLDPLAVGREDPGLGASTQGPELPNVGTSNMPNGIVPARCLTRGFLRRLISSVSPSNGALPEIATIFESCRFTTRIDSTAAPRRTS